MNSLAFYPRDTPEMRPDIQLINAEEMFISSSDNISLHAFFFPSDNSEEIILFLHGNSGNVYYRMDKIAALRDTGVNVLIVDYRGFGLSTGLPTEEGMYKDSVAAFHFIQNQLGFDNKKIFILGRSIGSAAAIHVASERDIGGLMLISPLASGKDVINKLGLWWLSWMVGSSFDNQSLAQNLTVPILIVHGSEDRVVKIASGKKLYDAILTTDKRFVEIEGAGHNNLMNLFEDRLWQTVSEFIVETRGIHLTENW
ncbi:MAG: alpha/beta hydrolase [Desulfobacteraceae bacterium]|nr:alpha/beta hydrolase [Desulfobacteraceae bacterium]